jgi:hypothetical protein
MDPYRPHRIKSVLDEPKIEEPETIENTEPKIEEPETIENTEPEKEAVPDGTVKEVLAWVGSDKEKAQNALNAENTKEHPRKGLVYSLEELLA